MPKRISVDVDGVLAHLDNRFLKAINEDYGTSYTMKDWTDWNIWDALPVLVDIQKKYGRQAAINVSWRYFDLGWLNPHKMQEVPAAGDAMRLLQKRDDLVLDIVTARRINSVPDVIRWIRMRNIPHNQIVVLDAFSPKTPDKATLPYDIYLDDSPGLARRMKDYPNKVLLLFDYPYNQGEFGMNVIRVKNWAEVCEWLR